MLSCKTNCTSFLLSIDYQSSQSQSSRVSATNQAGPEGLEAEGIWQCTLSGQGHHSGDDATTLAIQSAWSLIACRQCL